jgi:hypothetical protein
MKPIQTPEGDNALGQLLRQWTPDAPLAPRFQEQVWQRIARAEARPGPTLRASLSRWLEVVLPRPRFAFAYVLILLTLGVAGGSLAAQLKTSRLETGLGLRYVQSLDPYQGAPSPQP